MHIHLPILRHSCLELPWNRCYHQQGTVRLADSDNCVVDKVPMAGSVDQLETLVLGLDCIVVDIDGDSSHPFLLGFVDQP